jgi:hypothetical protein
MKVEVPGYETDGRNDIEYFSFNLRINRANTYGV